MLRLFLGQVNVPKYDEVLIRDSNLSPTQRQDGYIKKFIGILLKLQDKIIKSKYLEGHIIFRLKLIKNQ